MSEKNTDESRATGHAPKDFQPFHSAVNRIPLLRKKAKSLGNKAWNRNQKHRTRGQLTREQTGREPERTIARNAVGAFAKTVFHDGVAEGHDLLKPDRWSGSIDVEMTVHTPLVFGKHDGAQKHDGTPKHDGAQSDTEENSEAPTSEVSGSHRSKECEDGTPEEPFISPTMVKGTVSRAYETLTASRFRVFGSQSPDAGTDHRTRLTYRAGRSKKTYKKSPWELAKRQKALPLSEAREASAADRLFGYVIQKNNKRDNPEETDSKSAPSGTALRGRIIFSPVKILGPRSNPREPAESAIETLSEPHSLPPLLEPKPSSARRFITNKAGYTPTTDPGGALAKGKAMKPIHRKDYFKKGQFLGIAAYPIHRDVVCANTESPVNHAGKQKNQLPGTPSNKRGGANTNVTIDVLSFIKVGSTLYCRLDFTNLVPEELASLLWVLTPENLVPQSERNKHAHVENEGNKARPPAAKPPIGYLRMGLGKPFGLGAIEVRATSMTAYKGEDLAERYEALDGCLGHMPKALEISSPSIADFSSALDDYKLDEQPWVQAMQRAAYGYDDGVEVRYMSLKENKKNNQTDASSTNTEKAKAMWFPEKSLLKGQGLSPVDLFGSNAVYALKIKKLDSGIMHQSSRKQKADKRNRNGQGGNKSDTNILREGRNNNSTHNGSSAGRSRRKRGQTR